MRFFFRFFCLPLLQRLRFSLPFRFPLAFSVPFVQRRSHRPMKRAGTRPECCADEPEAFHSLSYQSRRFSYGLGGLTLATAQHPRGLVQQRSLRAEILQKVTLYTFKGQPRIPEAECTDNRRITMIIIITTVFQGYINDSTNKKQQKDHKQKRTGRQVGLELQTAIPA